MNTSRVSLRPLQNTDSPLLYEWINTRELVIFNSQYHQVSRTDHEKWMEAMMAKHADIVFFVIEELSTNQAIGTCQLLNISPRYRSAELQIRIGAVEYHGKGLGTEAVELLTRFGFTELNLHRIYLHVFSTNLRAIRVYEKCGFSREGLLRDAAFIDGSWVDVVVMGKLADDR